MKRDPKGIFFSSPPSAWFGAMTLFIVPIIGIMMAIGIPNILKSIQRGRQKTTMESMRLIGERIEQLKGPTGFPVLRSIDNLFSIDSTQPIQDGWDQPFKLISDADTYYIVSGGKDGRFEQTDPHLYQPGSTLSFEEDIVYCNGRFIRKPEGT